MRTYQIDQMIGRIPAKVKTIGSEELIFEFKDGSTITFFHEQGCCESVTIADITGDLQDLIGFPIVVAEERVSDREEYEYGEGGTWTFYTFRSVGGSVDVRWYGVSNGYYSESVDYKFTEGKQVQ